MYYVSKYQGFKNFKLGADNQIYFKIQRNLKLLLNIRIILSSNKMKQLEKHNF